LPEESQYIWKNIIYYQQSKKGCHSGSKGSKDQVSISKAILEDCKKRRKNLNMTWIGYERHLIVFHITG
jgi:hypothetical protein